MIVPLMLLCSCDKSRTLPSATGSIYDCLIVAPTTPLNEEERLAVASAYPNENGSAYEEDATNVQEVIAKSLDEPMPCMPQAEPYFKTSKVKPEAFDDFLKPTRNIVYIDINPDRYTQTKVHYLTDVYSHPQAVVQVQAASSDSLVSWWLEHGEECRTWLVEQEMKRAVAYLNTGTSQEIRDALKKMDVEMNVPSDYVLIKDSIDFVWACNNKGPMRKDIVVYRQPYTDMLQLTLGEIIETRDRVLGSHISAQESGSHMGTEYNVLPPVMSAIPYGAEVRGLWKMYDGEAMGGPFVSRSVVDSTRQWVVTAEVFVFAPGQKKRSALRQAEAILRTLKTHMPKEGTENDSVQQTL